MERQLAAEKVVAPGEELAQAALAKSKFEVWGEEMIQKEVRLSGTSGRVYLPQEWIGRQVKIIRID